LAHRLPVSPCRVKRRRNLK